MSSRRLLKAAAAIREVVSMAILAELRDPRVRDVTVLAVDVAPDMRSAKVHVSIMGDETKQNLALRGLQSAAGFLQSKIAKEIDTRYTPRLMFVLDQGVKKSIEIAMLLKDVLPPDGDSEDDTTDDTLLDDVDNGDADSVDEKSDSED
jgi:ribosome-binding factor A